MRFAPVLVGGALLACAALRPATASPLVDPTIGGMVFTGPTSAHVTSVYWNPAATGLVRGFRFYASSQLHADSYEVERTRIDTASGEPTDAFGQGTRGFDPAKGTLLSPSGFAGFTWDAGGDTLAIAAAVYRPTAEVQPEDHPQLRYHSLGGSLHSWNATIAVSYRLASRWIAGVGISASWSKARLRFAFDQKLETCAAAPCDVENPQASSEFDIETEYTSRPDFSFSGGLLWKARDDVWLGFSYHSPPGFAGISLSGTGTVITAPMQGGATVRGDAEVAFSLPHILQVGARWAMLPGRWDLLGSVRLMTLSMHDQFDLRLAGPELRDAGVREWMLRYRGLSDALQLEAGVETPAGALTRWGLRLRFDTGGVEKSHVAPEQIGGPTFDLSAGAQVALFGGFSLTFAASGGLMLPRHVGASVFSPAAQTDCVASGYDLDHCRGAREGSAIDTAAGDYKRYNFGVMLGISWDSI